MVEREEEEAEVVEMEVEEAEEVGIGEKGGIEEREEEKRGCPFCWGEDGGGTVGGGGVSMPWEREKERERSKSERIRWEKRGEKVEGDIWGEDQLLLLLSEEEE